MTAIKEDTLLRYCENLYDALAKTATRKYGFKLLWEGKIVELYSGLSFSNSHYSKIINTLQETGCVEIIRRGSRGSLHQMALYERPTAEILSLSHGLTSRLTNPTPYDRLSQRVSTLEGRLEGIELKTLLANYHKRISQLEAKSAKAASPESTTTSKS